MFFLAQMTSNDTTFIGVASTIIGAMAAAIVHLYLRGAKEFEDCKKDRIELWNEMRKLRGSE